MNEDEPEGVLSYKSEVILMSQEAQLTSSDYTKYLSRGTDYLGILETNLRNLRGFATLAYELIQNADDAPNATCMTFDVRSDALVVENDGIFSDCGHVEEADCPWIEDPKGHRCDFHRFRRVASGDKREQYGTTGAFGIGFIAVYQITDYPELISGGRHWILREEKPENERILVCPGCSKCKALDLPGTQFILPWARDPDSPLRKALRAEAVDPNGPDRLLQEVEGALPTAMLFLRNLERIELKKNGELHRKFERVRVRNDLLEGDDLLVNDGEKDHIWHLIHGTFEEEAQQLRGRYRDRIEKKHTANVTVAIPAESGSSGLLCSFLPTRHETGLPFHVNADFFPSSDRKKIIFGESDYQSEWNRTALKAAANILRSRFDRLPQILRHERLWRLITAIFKVSQEANRSEREQVLGYFWEQIAPELRDKRIIFTSNGGWCTPKEAALLETTEEEETVEILEMLDVKVVHQDIRRYIYRFQLPRQEVLGIDLLDIPHIIEGLQAKGLNARTDVKNLPKALYTPENRRILWRELGRLLKRRRSAERQRAVEHNLAECAIAPGRDGALWPCNAIYQADEETIALFGAIITEVPFLGEAEEDWDQLRTLCPEFSASAAIEWLGRFFEGAPEKANDEGLLEPVRLLGWFESHRDEILSAPGLKRALRDLPIFPTSTDLRPLSELSLPGDFTDHLGLAEVVDLNRLGGRREFLQDLGAEELTFESYVRDYLPRAFQDPDKIPIEKKRRVVRLLADRLGEIRDDEDIQEALENVPLVECQDGIFRAPGETYFEDRVTTMVLGNEIHIAVIPAEHEDAVRQLYCWLGVAEEPRLEEIVEEIRIRTSEPPSDDTIEAIQSFFSHLGERFKKEPEQVERLTELKTMCWLPAIGQTSRWFCPDEIYATFRRHLFESQALFLGIPRRIQDSSSDFLTFLGVKFEPTVSQVVNHLLACSEKGQKVNNEVYRFLNDNADAMEIGRLRGKACLLLPSDKYVRPTQVFWSAHPFGRFRYQLGPTLRSYGELFSRLGVREIPDYTDARRVILDIAEEYEESNRRLDEEAYIVLLQCWQMLSEALDSGSITERDLEIFRGRKVIPDKRHILNPPEWIFFEDRPGFAAKFEALENNVIQRPQGAWQAMAAAGVQGLSDAVEFQLLECEDRKEDRDIARRIRERRLQFKRVFETQAPGLYRNLSVLEELQYVSVRALKIRYLVKVFGRSIQSHQIESPTAHFHRRDNAMYFTYQNGSPVWSVLARELALAACSDVEPGRLAPGIRDVLSAETVEDAAAILDDLGFMPLEAMPIGDDVEPDYIDKLGGVSPPEGTEPVRQGEESGIDEEPEKKSSLSSEDAVKRVLGPDVPPPAPMPKRLKELLQTGGPTGRQPDVSKGEEERARRPSVGKPRGKFRTYVTYDGADEGTDTDRETAPEDNPVERAGVERILEHERQAGRFPEEMPPLHKGYDIESRDSKGTVLRYIEAKSLSGDWGPSGVGLTGPQFKKAEEFGEKYWLYVVERAEQDDYKIYRTQDPGRRVNQFFYDDGWQDLTEQEDGSGGSQ